MKKLLSFITASVLTLSCFSIPVAAQEKEMKAAWMATVFSIDFPSVKGDEILQKIEYIEKLDFLQETGINTVFVQVRPKGDALYESDINPWSEVLTGVQGMDPGYDPLEFMIEEAHDRGMEFHAWLNPYRVTTSGTDLSVLADGHPAKENPDWLIDDGSKLTYDPSNDDVKEHIRDTVREIVENYDVDGIHFDDYFYPSGYPLREGETARERIEHVSEMIEMVYKTVHKYGKDVVFGVSPSGICVNGEGFKGSQSVESVYADPRQWIEGEYIDYIIPQIYWELEHSSAPYEAVLNWWNEAVDGTDVKLYIGEAAYKENVGAEIISHLEIAKFYDNVEGHAYYSTRNLISNLGGCADALKEYYNGKTEEKPVAPPVIEEPEEEVAVPEIVIPTKPIRPVTAVSTNSKVLVDGVETKFEAYNIDGYNYFKLRDIAFALNGSEKQFDTLWDEKVKAINVKTGVPYTVAGGELKGGNGKNKTAVTSTALLYVNGKYVEAEAYNINDMNYYKLRDVAKAVDFAVVWSEALNSVGIVSMFGYEE
ncbi:MAG: family 10 glycosylhydrolase [Firmicutes bacterium]|nr:family 10 glycosylhydrolase [Bacillota bacterium]